MTVLFFILIVLVCIVVSFFVLIQNPKGGGLNGSIGGLSNQFMGVKQTNDVLEKGTWISAGVLGVLCLVSVMFFHGSNASDNSDNILKNINTNAPAQQAAPTNAAPMTAPQAAPQK